MSPPTLVSVALEPQSSVVPTTGREQRRATPVAQARTPDFERFYRKAGPPLVPGEFTFRLDVKRPGTGWFPIDHMVDSFGWTDEQSVLTGNLTAYRPDPDSPATLPVSRGDLVRCRVQWGSHTYELWTMRVDPTQYQKDTGQLQVTLQDDLALLEGTNLDWYFRRTRSRPHGWTAHEITLAVCRRLGMRLGTIAKGHARFTLSQRQKSGLAVVKAAWANEQAANGAGWVIRMRNGKLDVVPLQRNPLIYILDKQIRTALLTQKAGTTVPTTVLEGHGHIGTGKHVRKVSYTAHDRLVVQTLGYVHKVKDYGLVRSSADLRAQVKRDYASGLRMNDTITIEHQGIPFIQRGDAVQVRLPNEGYSNQESFVFATRCNHVVQAGVYTTDWDFTLVDAYVAAIKAAQAALAAQQAKSGSRNLNLAPGTGKRFMVVASSEDDPPGATASCGPLPADRRGYSVLSISGYSSDAGTAGQGLSPGSVWPCGTVLRLTNPANGRTTTARHVDNGAGDSFRPVIGIYPTTRAELGIPNGWNGNIIIQRVDGGSLSPVRGSAV